MTKNGALGDQRPFFMLALQRGIVPRADNSSVNELV
jgi:hypothetical protein